MDRPAQDSPGQPQPQRIGYMDRKRQRRYKKLDHLLKKSKSAWERHQLREVAGASNQGSIENMDVQETLPEISTTSVQVPDNSLVPFTGPPSADDKQRHVSLCALEVLQNNEEIKRARDYILEKSVRNVHLVAEIEIGALEGIYPDSAIIQPPEPSVIFYN